jgi:hypothetical protein
MRTLLIFALVYFASTLIIAPNAQATTRMQKLATLGDRTFGPAPCGVVTTTWADPSDYGVEGAAAWADTDRCIIYIDEIDRHMAMPFLCQRWLHERGHIDGYHHQVGVLSEEDDGTLFRDHDHSPDRRSLMYPHKSEQSGWEGRGKNRRYVYAVDRRCQPKSSRA